MAKNTRDAITIMTLDDVYEEVKKRDVQLDKKYSYVHPKKTRNKTITLSLGRCWLNCCLPDKIGLVDEPADKKKLNDIIKQIFEKLPVEKAAEAITKLNKEAFKLSTIAPVTFDIDSLIIPQRIIDRKNAELTIDTKPEEFGTKLANISEDYIEEIKDSGIGKIINSGAKGNAADFGVLTLAKGPTVDIEGKISKPIISSLIDGYSGEEYYTGAAEARRTAFIRGVGTEDPGYLARTVTYANANILIDGEDCGTKKYLELFVRPSMVDILIGRFMINERTGELVEITNASKIANRIIQLRSPLYCKSKKGICKTCYGGQLKKLSTKHIGMLAGSAINQAGVEGYSMKARHESSQVKLREADFTADMLHI